MKITTSYQRRQLAANDIPLALKELFVSLSGMLTRNLFQVEINRRLGPLFRVSGIDLQVIPHQTSAADHERAVPNQVRFPITFTDGDCDLVFTFGLALLSERSKEGIYDAAVTILSDLLKVVSMSGPVALQRFRRTERVRRLPTRISDTIPTVREATTDEVATIAGLNRAKPKLFTPPYDPTKFAHRLRNLLSAIMSGSSQLAVTDLSTLHPDDLQLIETIENAAAAQEELIRRYLMAYGPLRLNLRNLDLGQTLRSTVQLYDAKHDRRTEFDTDLNETVLISDAGIIGQIVTELLHNAHEASPPTERVTVRGSIVDRQALIFIKNRGEIAAADFDGSFSRPFYTTKAGSSGLGLCIARRYATLLGASIRGLSLHGYTIVNLCLPLTQDDIISQPIERESQCPQS